MRGADLLADTKVAKHRVEDLFHIDAAREATVGVPVAPTPPGAGTRKAALTRADQAGMTPDEINTRWSEVQEALKR